MGNFVERIAPSTDESTGASAKVKDQANSKSEIYKLVQPPNSSAEGRGTLVDEAALCFKNKNFLPLRETIRTALKEYLYEDGEGKDIEISKLIDKRKQEREAKKRANERKGIKSWFSGTAQASSSFNSDNSSNPFGSGKQDEKEKQTRKKQTRKCCPATPKQTRKCCWDIEKRGALGETVLHVCLLNNTMIHNRLAKELIEVYPNLLHDIYIGYEYYGESPLHMAIANEDKNMVKFILEKSEQIGLNLQERCIGNFFFPRDQVPTISDYDNDNIEEVKVDLNTKYKGLVYWGEYPLSFAACSNQIDLCFLLLNTKKVSIKKTDTNGNNVLHMMVIHQNREVFDFCYHAAKDDRLALLTEENRQRLTPLTLAAKLANKEMLDHILELKREVVWVFGDVTCAHYPITNIDTINSKTGKINNLSALSIILNEETSEHLSMLDGLPYQLLHEKWKEYAKVRFFQRFALFFAYLVIFGAAVLVQLPQPAEVPGNSAANDCYLLELSNRFQISRFVLEVLTLIGALLYLLMASIDIFNEGFQSFWFTIVNAPTRGSFLLSCVLIVAVIPCRYTCTLLAENVILTLAIFTCFPYLLFFCRGFKVTGPFVVAIYKMIKGDLLKFLLIYIVFLMGFSQAMYIVFRGTPHFLFSYPILSILAMFMMTLGEFSDLYSDFDLIRQPNAAKFLFVLYIILVTLLLISVLIAMFGNTFTAIADTRWEWQRQWAKIVLVVEHSISPKHRKEKQQKYSISDKDELWFVIRKSKSKE